MKIAIDLTSVSYHMTGIERYAACVSKEMIKQDRDNEYIFIFRNEVYSPFKKYIDKNRIKAVILHGNNKLVFNQIILPWILYKVKADKYVFFAFTSPVFFRKKGIINTIHDMGAWDSPEAMKPLQKFYWQTTMICSAMVSERIITVSEFSKGRINEILNYPRDRIEVIHSAVYEGVIRDYGYTFKDIQDKYNLPEKYIMTLSTLEPRKNMEILLKAFTEIQNQVDYDLVLVGRKGWKMDEVINKYNKNGRIHITGFIEDKHLSTVYKNAMCFVVPSLYEGFGLPPVEALALGTPVISSDAASLPEVLRDQAVYFHNNNENELEKLLSELERNVDSMPHGLDDYQRENYRFDMSARKVLDSIFCLS